MYVLFYGATSGAKSLFVIPRKYTDDAGILSCVVFGCVVFELYCVWSILSNIPKVYKHWGNHAIALIKQSWMMFK